MNEYQSNVSESSGEKQDGSFENQQTDCRTMENEDGSHENPLTNHWTMENKDDIRSETSPVDVFTITVKKAINQAMNLQSWYLNSLKKSYVIEKIIKKGGYKRELIIFSIGVLLGCVLSFCLSVALIYTDNKKPTHDDIESENYNGYSPTQNLHETVPANKMPTHDYMDSENYSGYSPTQKLHETVPANKMPTHDYLDSENYSGYSPTQNLHETVTAKGFTTNSGYSPTQNRCAQLAGNGDCDFYQSLMNNVPETSNFVSELGSVSWYRPLTGASGEYFSHECNRNGVLKVTPNSGASDVDIHVGICNPLGFSIHIGDSYGNDGYGGDYGSSKGWAAEIHNINTKLLAFENVAWRRVGPPVAQHNFYDYFNSTGSTLWTVNLDRCNKVTLNTVPESPGTHYTMQDDNMFHFDAFYIGLNQVITGRSGRHGAGVCDICIKFHTGSYNKWCTNRAGYDYCTC